MILNAVIQSADLTILDHGMLSADIRLKLQDGGEASYGGYNLGVYTSLDNPNNKLNFGGIFIAKVLLTVGVYRWSDLPRKAIRADISDHLHMIQAIGHIIEEKWLNSKDLYSQLQAEQSK